MSTPLSLQDILVSIADSLSQAQQQLNNMPQYDSLGRPNTIYQLPYLDFNIELSTKFNLDKTIEEDKMGDDSYRIVGNNVETILGKRQTKQLLFEPAATSAGSLPYNNIKLEEELKQIREELSIIKEVGIGNKIELIPYKQGLQNNSGTTVTKSGGTGETQMEITEETTTGEGDGGESKTVISGRFIAVLPNEGLPQTIINITEVKKEETTAKKKTALNEEETYLIKVNLMNTAGEILPNHTVEFNFDEGASFLFNKHLLAVPPIFTLQEVVTDGSGSAETEVTFTRTKSEDSEDIVIIRINSGVTTKSLSI